MRQDLQKLSGIPNIRNASNKIGLLIKKLYCEIFPSLPFSSPLHSFNFWWSTQLTQLRILFHTPQDFSLTPHIVMSQFYQMSPKRPTIVMSFFLVKYYCYVRIDFLIYFMSSHKMVYIFKNKIRWSRSVVKWGYHVGGGSNWLPIF